MPLALKYWFSASTLWALLALASFAAAMGLAAHHPSWPVAMLALVCVVSATAAAWRGFWLLAIPAGLPWLNFSPWTGWLIFDEFDLLLLSVFAGSYAHMAWRARAASPERSGPAQSGGSRGGWLGDRVFALLVMALALSALGSLAIGLNDAGGMAFGWFQGYADPLNSLRVFKSLLWAILTIALTHDLVRERGAAAARPLAKGMVLGVTIVVLAVLHERLAYPGLTDFAVVYRATALFWEMHVGGGAIDTYLALASPFAWWALSTAQRPWARVGSAFLAVLVVYACLVTFSRGIYLAVALPALLLAVAAALRTGKRKAIGTPGQSPGSSAAATAASPRFWLPWLVAVAMAFAVLAPTGFMTNRLEFTHRVLEGRLAHWRAAVDLLHSRTDWILGMGLGRFPSRYGRDTEDGEFPGSVLWHGGTPGDAQDRSYVTLSGPARSADLDGLFALTRRVPIVPGVRYQVDMDVRVSAPTVLVVQVCERHLLYEWNCQGALIRVAPSHSKWMRRSIPLGGPVFESSPWYAPRLGMLTVSVLGAGGSADMAYLGLQSPALSGPLANGDFSRGMAHWFPAAQRYFLPWHADSLYLETVLERGLVGLALLAGLLLLAAVRLARSASAMPSIVPFLAASLLGVVLVGAVSSVMDAPRVAFLFHFLVFFSIQLAGRHERMAPVDPAAQG